MVVGGCQVVRCVREDFHVIEGEVDVSCKMVPGQ
jgi:hypothetical protein